MKKVFVKVSFLLVLILSLIACSSSNTSQPPTPAPSTNTNTENKTEEPTKVDTIHLKSSSHIGPGAMNDTFDAFLDEIEKRTDGQIKFERFYQGALVGGTDVVDALRNGVADVALVNASQQSGRIPLGTVATNPAIFSNPWATTKAMTELYDLFPELKEENEKVGVVDIGWITMPTAYVMSTKPVSSLDDLKGLRILSNTRGITTLLADLGATPIGLPIVESYEALSRGAAEAIAISYQAGSTNGIHEVVDSVWTLPVGGGNMFYGMNKKVWDSLPDHLKEIIQEVRAEFQPDSSYKIYIEQGDSAAFQRFVDNNVEIIEASEEDINHVVENYATKVWDIWVKEMDEAGLPGQEVLDTFRQLVEKYENEFPF